MMAGTIYQQQLSSYAKEAEEEGWKKSKPSSRYPYFKHKVTREPLWMDSRDAPSWVIGELRSTSGGDPCQGAALSADPCQSMSQIDAFVASLRACTRNKDLVRGTSIHADLVQRGLLAKCSHALVIMYVKCGELGRAKELLDMHKSSSNVVTWTALIAGYARREGHSQNALDCFEQMQRKGILPDAVTYACILKACAMIGAADKGKQVHDEIKRKGLLQNDIVLNNALVSMYAKCGHAEQALDCYEEMQHEGILPNAVTYTCILKACATIGAADKGKQIYDEIARQGMLQNNIVLGNALVDMFAKCGAVSQARQVLDGLPSRDVVSWSALISGYAQGGHAEQALDCFEEMQREGILPNAVTYACILKACATIKAADKGKQIFDEIARQGLLQNNIVLGNALVDMFAKCGSVSKARQVLDGLPSRNVVSWSALIAGYAQGGHADQALGCFEEMQREGILPDAVTYACILKACATIRAIDKGKQIYDEIARQGLLLQNNLVLGNALVDMFAKCSAFSKARQVLDGLPSRDVVSWNALIAGYAQEGLAEQALGCIEEMQCEGILPNAVSCVCVLNVCSHRGLVEVGQALFVNMSTKYGVNPSLECYACMVDLIGRAGHLEKAVRLIQGMPSSDYSIIWHTLLGACWKWADVNVGRWAFERAVKLDKSDGPAYVLMENIYATAGMGQKAENIEAMRIRNRAWKKPGCSGWIDSSNVIHEFSVGDTKLAQRRCIDVKLEDIAHKMSQQGYSPGLHWVS